MAVQLTPLASTLGVTAGAGTAADATGNYIVPDGRSFVVRVRNGSGVSTVVTIDDPNTPALEGVTLDPDAKVTVASATTAYLVFDQARIRRFVDRSTGRISFSFAGGTLASILLEVVAV